MKMRITRRARACRMSLLTFVPPTVGGFYSKETRQTNKQTEGRIMKDRKERNKKDDD